MLDGVVRILLVEDEPLIASFVSRGLRAEGYTTSIAAGGDEAVRRAPANASGTSSSST